MDGGKKFGYSGIGILRPPKYAEVTRITSRLLLAAMLTACRI
jgi:hypothetical protein